MYIYIYIYIYILHACTRIREVCDDWDAQNEKEIESVRAACQRLGRIIPSATGKTQFPGQNLMFGRPARWGLIGFPGAVNRARARVSACENRRTKSGGGGSAGEAARSGMVSKDCRGDY